jgi:hypothetical protein
MSRGLLITGLPPASGEPFAGGPAFVAYCSGAETRVKHRREAIKRAQAAHRRAASRTADPYPTALIYGQRLGVALEDLGRLAIALEALGRSDAFDALRGARPSDLDSVFNRLRDEEALRTALQLPTVADVAELPEELRDPLLAASSAMASRWVKQWTSCAGGWPLLRLLAKGMRHGSPLVPRNTVTTPPGAGALGAGAVDRSDRWVLVIDTAVDDASTSISTQWSVVDISDTTLARAHAAVLDGLALARALAGAHVGRVAGRFKWVLPRSAAKTLSPEHRAVLERHHSA